MTNNSRAKSPRKRAQRPIPIDQQEKAEAVMAVVFDLARQAYLGAIRLRKEGVGDIVIPHEEHVRSLLGIAPEPEIKPVIEAPAKKPLLTVVGDRVKRFLD